MRNGPARLVARRPQRPRLCRQGMPLALRRLHRGRLQWRPQRLMRSMPTRWKARWRWCMPMAANSSSSIRNARRWSRATARHIHVCRPRLAAHWDRLARHRVRRSLRASLLAHLQGATVPTTFRATAPVVAPASVPDRSRHFLRHAHNQGFPPVAIRSLTRPTISRRSQRSCWRPLHWRAPTDPMKAWWAIPGCAPNPCRFLMSRCVTCHAAARHQMWMRPGIWQSQYADPPH